MGSSDINFMANLKLLYVDNHSVTVCDSFCLWMDSFLVINSMSIKDFTVNTSHFVIPYDYRFFIYGPINIWEHAIALFLDYIFKINHLIQ